MLSLTIIVCVSAIIYRTSKNPFFGLLMMIAINSIEGLVKLPGDLSLSRIVGLISVLAWIIYLNNDKPALKRLVRSKLIRIIWAFPVCCFLGVVFSWTNTNNDYSSVIKVFLLAIMSIMIENLVYNKKRIYDIVLVFGLSALIASIFPLAISFGLDLYSFFGLSPDDAIKGGRTAGLTNNANSLGIALSTGLFSLLILTVINSRIVIKILILLFAFAIINALMLTGSRTHFIASILNSILFLILFFMGPVKRIGFIIIMVPLLFTFMFLAYQSLPEDIQKRFILIGSNVNNETYERADFADNQRALALKVLFDKPIFGVGLSNFNRISEGHGTHDSISSLLGETGFIGVLSFSLLAVSSFQGLYRSLIYFKKYNFEIFNYIIGFMSSYITMFIVGWGGYIIFYQRWFWITVGFSAIFSRWTKETSLGFSGKQLPNIQEYKNEISNNLYRNIRSRRKATR